MGAAKVMGDKEEGLIPGLLAKEPECLMSHEDIEARCGFISDDKRRVAGEYHGNEDTFPHPPGKLVGVPFQGLFDIRDTHALEQREDSRLGLFFGDAPVKDEGFGDLAADG